MKKTMQMNDEMREFERKVNIRQNAYINMKGISNVYTYGQTMSTRQVYEINNHINELLLSLEEYRTIIAHKNIACDSKKGKGRVLLKKVLRKFMEKLFGWYYLPLIEQQNVFNSHVVDMLMELRKLVINQYEIYDEIENK